VKTSYIIQKWRTVKKNDILIYFAFSMEEQLVPCLVHASGVRGYEILCENIVEYRMTTLALF